MKTKAKVYVTLTWFVALAFLSLVQAQGFQTDPNAGWSFPSPDTPTVEPTPQPSNTINPTTTPDVTPTPTPTVPELSPLLIMGVSLTTLVAIVVAVRIFKFTRINI